MRLRSNKILEIPCIVQEISSNSTFHTAMTPSFPYTPFSHPCSLQRVLRPRALDKDCLSSFTLISHGVHWRDGVLSDQWTVSGFKRGWPNRCSADNAIRERPYAKPSESGIANSKKYSKINRYKIYRMTDTLLTSISSITHWSESSRRSIDIEDWWNCCLCHYTENFLGSFFLIRIYFDFPNFYIDNL